MAKAYKVGIDTIVGANQRLEKLSAAQDQIMRRLQNPLKNLVMGRPAL